jgi:hypothetical protein
MSRSIDEIEFDSLPLHTYWSELDGDTTFSLKVHVIECLRLELTLLESASYLHEAVCERRLPMIDMCDDTEVTDGGWFGHGLVFLLD